MQVPSRDRILTDITNGELKFSTAFAHAPLARTVVAPESENWSTREEMDASKVLTEMEASKVLTSKLTAHPPNIATFYKILAQAPVRFRCVSMIYRCKVCEGADKLRKDWKTLLKTRAKSPYVPGTPARGGE